MANVPPEIRQPLSLPVAPVEISAKMIAPGFPVYLCWLIVMGALALLPTAISMIIKVAMDPGSTSIWQGR